MSEGSPIERGASARECVDLYLVRWAAFDKVADIGYRYAVEALGPEAVERLCGRST